MKNRLEFMGISGGKIALILSCILSIGIILLSVWYSKSLEEELTPFKKGTEYVATETLSYAKTPKTLVHSAPLSDNVAAHTQQTSDEPMMTP